VLLAALVLLALLLLVLLAAALPIFAALLVPLALLALGLAAGALLLPLQERGKEGGSGGGRDSGSVSRHGCLQL
jgi:hypothetical protein